MKKPRKKKRSNGRAIKRRLRSGSKAAKKILLQLNPHCDICGKEGNSTTLHLHHVYCIRWGFTTKLEHCVLLCATCHRKFHSRWDKYLDITFEENKDADFMAIYRTLKKL